MPLHRFDGFRVGVTSDSSETGATLTLADADQNSRLRREGEEHVSRDLRSIVTTVPIRLAGC
jgi:hypothetical protein